MWSHFQWYNSVLQPPRYLDTWTLRGRPTPSRGFLHAMTDLCCMRRASGAEGRPGCSALQTRPRSCILHKWASPGVHPVITLSFFSTCHKATWRASRERHQDPEVGCQMCGLLVKSCFPQGPSTIIVPT